MCSEEEKLKLLIEDAEKIHGHLGPFLVIGVRMGRLAEKILTTKRNKNVKLQVHVKLPMLTPFSCILDGIQTTTKCTIGNQKLKIENSQKEITAHFILQKPDKSLKVTVNQKMIEELTNKMSEGVSTEELEWETAHAPENQLFIIERQ
ncbi:MAG: formylmethanofuran dehydrogenase subunit E family protein [Candidatus Bathyarchaeia archaeon]